MHKRTLTALIMAAVFALVLITYRQTDALSDSIKHKTQPFTAPNSLPASPSTPATFKASVAAYPDQGQTSNTQVEQFMALPNDENVVAPELRYRDQHVAPHWAPIVEATLDSIIRGLGGPVRDVASVRCTTSSCSAKVLLHYYYFTQGESEQVEAFESLMQRLESIIDRTQFAPIHLSGGAPFVQLSSEIPSDENFTETVGATFSFEVLNQGNGFE